MQLGVRVKQYVTLGHICPTVCLYFDFKPNSSGLWVFVETQELNLRLLGWICAFWAGFEHPGLELNLSFGACKLQVSSLRGLGSWGRWRTVETAAGRNAAPPVAKVASEGSF